MKFYYKKDISKKGKPYHCIGVDLGYEEIPLTFDGSVCAQVLDCKQSDLSKRKCGTVILCEGADENFKEEEDEEEEGDEDG